MFVITREEFKEMIAEVNNHQQGCELTRKLSEHINFSIKFEAGEYVLTLVDTTDNLGEVYVIVSKEKYYHGRQGLYKIRFCISDIFELNDDYYKLDVRELREILFPKMDVASF